jgi:hypothetical protein
VKTLVRDTDTDKLAVDLGIKLGICWKKHCDTLAFRIFGKLTVLRQISVRHVARGNLRLLRYFSAGYRTFRDVFSLPYQSRYQDARSKIHYFTPRWRILHILHCTAPAPLKYAAAWVKFEIISSAAKATTCRNTAWCWFVAAVSRLAWCALPHRSWIAGAGVKDRKQSRSKYGATKGQIAARLERLFAGGRVTRRRQTRCFSSGR